MRTHRFEAKHRMTLWICLGAGSLGLTALVTGCHSSGSAAETVVQKLDLSHDGQYTSGDWTYVYSITDAGTRSEGYRGVLSYQQIELPAPMRINDYYKTPWGPLYWIGEPMVPFGSHGWMPRPLGRDPIGQALIDPAIAHSDRLVVHLIVLAPEELDTPDRLEKDPNVLATLKPFGLKEAHIQRDWFAVGSDPIALHDTKRWGLFKVCRADLNQYPTPTLEFTCTTDLTADKSPRPASLMDLMAAPQSADKPNRVSLSPQVDTLQPIRCTLTPAVGDPLVLYMVCRIEDRGSKGP